MEYLKEGVEQIGASNGFANAFWIFLGIVCGVLIQFFFNWLTARQQRRNAVEVLKVEIEMNLVELDLFLQKLNFLRERIAANQIEPNEVFVSMQGFDFSAMSPLIATGHFHHYLGSSGSRAYFEFARFFSDANAVNLNSMLKTDHASGKSLALLKLLEERSAELGVSYGSLIKGKQVKR